MDHRDPEVQELYADFKRSYKAWRRGRQAEEPTAFDFCELTDEEITRLRHEVEEEIAWTQ